MSLETLKLIDGAEIEALRRKEAALAEAKKEIADAREDGELRLRKARQDAGQEADRYLREQTALQEKEADRTRMETRRECMALRAEAQGRMSDAASAVLERIVKG